MQTERLRVTLYGHDLQPIVDDEGNFIDDEVDFVSLYNGGTHGPPALVAPGRESGVNVPTRATIGDTVMYINTALVPAFTAERIHS
jgi:hypothetical protein